MSELLQSIHFSSNIWALAIPFILMGIDIVTGLINAWIKNIFASAKMRSGLGKKIGEAVIILLGELFFYGAGLPKQIMNGIIIYICFMELMSILENLDKLGVKLPKDIKTRLNNSDQDEKDIEELIAVIKEQEDKENELHS